MAEKVEELFGIHPGRDWVRWHDASCPFASEEKEHMVSRHPRQPFFWCVECCRSWFVRGIDPVLDQRLSVPP